WDEAERKKIRVFDRLATITELTARTIANEIKHCAKKYHLADVLVSGGGRYNPVLMERLDANLSDMLVMPIDKANMNADAKEAMVFALLGYQCYHKRTNSIPT